MNEGSSYLVFPNDKPIAESLWTEGKDIHNSVKFSSPYLLVLKVMDSAVAWDKDREWSTYVYHDLNSALAHIDKKNKNEHRLYLFNNYGEASELSLVRSIRRVELENGNGVLVFRDENIQDFFSCPASSTPIGKESGGHPIYLKSYRPNINWLLKG